MNKKAIYKHLSMTLICGAVATSLQAQSSAKDTTYRRQISVERDFNPTLQDANKINALPSLYEPTVKKSNAPLANWSASGTPKLGQLTNLGAGNFGTDLQHDKKRGYVGLSLGTHGNIQGEAGYQAISTEKTKLDLFGTYNASSATPKKIDYLEDNNAKAKFNEAFFKVGFQQKFNPFTLFLSTSYLNEGYNYFGAIYNSSTTSSSTDYTSKQTANVFHLVAGIQSKDEITMRYTAHVMYDNLGLKYGQSIDNKGPKASVLQADFNFNTDFGSDRVIGINIHTFNQSLSKDYKDLHALTHLKFNPYLNFTGGNWKATLGVNGHLTFDSNDKVLLVPNVAASWNFLETSALYLSVVGDVNENTYLNILQENRYADPTVRISPSRTYYDGVAGVKTGVVKGLEFEFFGGYKYTSSEHFYYVPASTNTLKSNSVLYANLQQGKLGGQVKTNLIPVVDLSAKLTTYFYNVKYRGDETNMPKAAWGKPTYSLELNADINPVNNFVVSANYLLAGGRKYYDASLNEKHNMKAINEMNVKGAYAFTKNISASVAVNNCFNQKYELYPGYANYGANFLVGASVKF